MSNLNFSTRAIREADRNSSVIRSAGHGLGCADRAEKLYAWEDINGDVYSRISNPTVRDLEKALANLEGGTAAVATSSGQAAVFLALEALLQPGTNVIAASKLYGGTFGLLSDKFPKFGFETRWADPTDPSSFAKQIDDNTRALFFETVSNPDGTVPDFDGLAAVAKERNIPVIVDNTLASPYLFRPFDHGAAIIVHSTTKFINGHGSAVGGAVIDGGTFHWEKDPRYPALSNLIPGCDVSLADRFPKIAYAVLIRQSLAVFGSCQSPDNAALTLAGLKTLALRMERHVANAKAVAEFLASQPCVSDVRYPGLASDPNHERAAKYLPKGAGAVVLFTLKDGRDAAVRVLHSLGLFSHKANIGETGSLVIHPATTTHNQCPKEQLEAAGIYPGTLRLVVGLEDPGDLIADLHRALSGVTAIKTRAANK